MPPVVSDRIASRGYSVSSVDFDATSWPTEKLSVDEISRRLLPTSTSEHLAKYVDQRQAEGAANATINRDLAALKRMFSLGHKANPKKVLHMPPFPHLKEDNIRQGLLEDSQYEKLVEGAELWFKTLLECGSTIGWRRQELLTLRVKQSDLEQRTIRLEPGTTKNREGREAPMTDTMLHLLTACVEGKGTEDRILTRSNGEPVRDFSDRWSKACCLAGLD